MIDIEYELIAFWLALFSYSLSTVVSIIGLVFSKWPHRLLPSLMVLGWSMHTTAIAIRWERLEHLPFINTFEQLSANIWGLMGALLIGYWALPRMRPVSAVLLPIIMMICAWMLLVPNDDSGLPYTFHTFWLYIHIAMIKIFLGSAFVALGLSVFIVMRHFSIGDERLSRLPGDHVLDITIYRCMAIALIFDTLGVVSGAIWAQNAWGRYWAWVPIEIWSLITWLSIALMLHARQMFRTAPITNAVLVMLTFFIAFFTFFGIPFVTEKLHQGTF